MKRKLLLHLLLLPLLPVRSETSFGSAPRFREDLIYGVAYDSMGVGYVVRWRVDRGRDRPG